MRQSLIDKNDKKYSLRRQCRLLGLNRSGLYYKAAGISQRDRTLMNLLDEQYTRTPFWGVRNMTSYIKDAGYPETGRGHVRTLLRRMGLMAIYPKRRFKLSQPNKAHKIYPYLLRDVEIVRPNQVWSADITYVRLAFGFAYLAAVIDWYSRAVLSWRLSNTLDCGFCVEALREALAKYGCPEIFNSDQGCQFTSREFILVLTDSKISISMDGRGRCLDNIFVERLWRSVKYEDIYLKGYQTIPEAKAGLAKYFDFYNHRRYHQALDSKTPWQVYMKIEGVPEYGSSLLRGLTGLPNENFLAAEPLKTEIALLAH
jgi:putative transposase